MGTASGVSTAFCGTVSVSPFESLARTLSVGGCVAGRGTALTRLALTDSPVEELPHTSPWEPPNQAHSTMATASRPCRPAAISIGAVHLSRSSKMSTRIVFTEPLFFCFALLYGFGHDTDIGDARGLHRVHDGGESAERHAFIGAHIDRLSLGIADLFPQFGGDIVDVHRFAVYEYFLLAAKAHHHPLFGDGFHRLGFGDCKFNARLQHRSDEHEYDEKNQNNVYQGGDVYFAQRGLGVAPLVSERLAAASVG